jgi:hypothetical protein
VTDNFRCPGAGTPVFGLCNSNAHLHWRTLLAKEMGRPGFLSFSAIVFAVVALVLAAFAGDISLPPQSVVSHASAVFEVGATTHEIHVDPQAALQLPNAGDFAAQTNAVTSVPPTRSTIANLQPGNYTAIVRGVSNTMGVALVEVYDLN